MANSGVCSSDKGRVRRKLPWNPKYNLDLIQPFFVMIYFEASFGWSGYYLLACLQIECWDL